MAVYAVTGGAGFIGSNIVRHLILNGQSVRVIDDLSTGRRDNLAGPRGDMTFFKESVCDLGVLRRVFEGADYVLHQAAVPSVPLSINDPLRTDEVNVRGTLNVLIAARDCAVRRVVYASTSAVYGNAPGEPKREEMAPSPESPYAVSKLAGEQYCRVFAQVYGLETVALRYFNVYGPHQDPHSDYAAVIPAFITRLLQGEQPRVFGDGEQTRDFVFVEDVVRANLSAAHAEGASGGAINVGSGEARSLNELLAILAELLHEEVEPEYCEPRPGDVRHSRPDVGRARELIGFEAATDFREGLRRTLDWYMGKEATTFFLAGPEQ